MSSICPKCGYPYLKRVNPKNRSSFLDSKGYRVKTVDDPKLYWCKNCGEMK